MKVDTHLEAVGISAFAEDAPVEVDLAALEEAAELAGAGRAKAK